MSVWLVTWEASKASLRPPKRVAAVLDGRTSGEQVRRIVEAIYAYHTYSEAELVAFAARGRNPYRATLGDVGGVPYDGLVTCGQDPFLTARLVDDLTTDPNGVVTWTERLPPEPRALIDWPDP